MFTLGNATFACGVRSARERSFEEASGESRWKLEDACWRRSHTHCRCWRWRRGHAAPVRKPNPNLNRRPPRALFSLKLNNSCYYARHSNCNVVVKLVQEYHCFFIHFTSILWKQFTANDMFLMEANNYIKKLTDATTCILPYNL